MSSHLYRHHSEYSSGAWPGTPSYSATNLPGMPGAAGGGHVGLAIDSIETSLFAASTMSVRNEGKGRQNYGKSTGENVTFCYVFESLQ